MQLKWTLALGFSRLFGQNAPGKCSQVKVSSREFTFGFVPQPNWIEAMPGKTVTVGMLVPLSKKTFRKAPIDNYITSKHFVHFKYLISIRRRLLPLFGEIMATQHNNDFSHCPIKIYRYATVSTWTDGACRLRRKIYRF